MEIYNEEIRDLLSKNPTNRLELKEDPDKGVYVKDLTAVVVKDYAEIDQVLTLGNKHRTVGAVRPHTPPSSLASLPADLRWHALKVLLCAGRRR